MFNLQYCTPPFSSHESCPPCSSNSQVEHFLALYGAQSFKHLESFYSFCVSVRIEQAAWNCNVRALFCFHPPESPTNFPGNLLVRDVFTYGVRDSYAEFETHSYM